MEENPEPSKSVTISSHVSRSSMEPQQDIYEIEVHQGTGLLIFFYDGGLLSIILWEDHEISHLLISLWLSQIESY